MRRTGVHQSSHVVLGQTSSHRLRLHRPIIVSLLPLRLGFVCREISLKRLRVSLATAAAAALALGAALALALLRRGGLLRERRGQVLPAQKTAASGVSASRSSSWQCVLQARGCSAGAQPAGTHPSRLRMSQSMARAK
jgi:hypothetical protein